SRPLFAISATQRGSPTAAAPLAAATAQAMPGCAHAAVPKRTHRACSIGGKASAIETIDVGPHAAIAGRGALVLNERAFRRHAHLNDRGVSADVGCGHRVEFPLERNHTRGDDVLGVLRT